MDNKVKNQAYYEGVLKDELGQIMKEKKVKFPVFLEALVPDIAEKSKEDQLKILKKEYMKYTRACLTAQEVFGMLKLVDMKLVFTLNNKPIDINQYLIESYDNKIRFTDLMAVADMFNIKVEFESIENPLKSTRTDLY